MLLNAGGNTNARRARDVLQEAMKLRATDERVLYLLSRAERMSGNLAGAEDAARKLVAQNADNPRGYLALAETLSERRRHQEIVDALLPAATRFRSIAEGAVSLGLLLPRLAAAHQQLGRHDEAIAIFEELRRLSPKDPNTTHNLIRAHLFAKRYRTAVDVARLARADRPDDISLARLEAEALRQDGKADDAVAAMSALAVRRKDDPEAYVALANVYSEVNRGGQAIKVLQEAQTRFPNETLITFELGAVYERQKQYAEAEAAFRRVIERDAQHAPALNYLGYMLAERGERLGESIALVKRALEVDPENGSYLDSLGWAYFKSGKFDLAEEYLRQAAGILTANSVILDHYGDVLLKLERFQEAIDAWTQALAGDGDSINRGDIDRKIRTARQRLDRR
jgi:tetratricopeptide (TPR) repeat protein